MPELCNASLQNINRPGLSSGSEIVNGFPEGNWFNGLELFLPQKCYTEVVGKYAEIITMAVALNQSVRLITNSTSPYSLRTLFMKIADGSVTTVLATAPHSAMMKTVSLRVSIVRGLNFHPTRRTPPSPHRTPRLRLRQLLRLRLHLIRLPPL